MAATPAAAARHRTRLFAAWAVADFFRLRSVSSVADVYGVCAKVNMESYTSRISDFQGAGATTIRRTVKTQAIVRPVTNCKTSMTEMCFGWINC